MRAQQLSSGVAALACLGFLLLSTVKSYATSTPPSTVRCRAVESGFVNGPCAVPEAQQVLPGAGAAAPFDSVLVTNFGLLIPAEGGARYELVCEETFGGIVSNRVARKSADGALLVPGRD